jgi:hypothetical protein
MLNGDQMLSAELSLLGPYVHVAECLASRGMPRTDEKRILELLRPPGQPALERHPEQYLLVLHEMIQSAALTAPQKLACYGSALGYYLAKFEWSRIRPLRATLGPKLRELGIPIDRLSPFR